MSAHAPSKEGSLACPRHQPENVKRTESDKVGQQAALNHSSPSSVHPNEDSVPAESFLFFAFFFPHVPRYGQASS